MDKENNSSNPLDADKHFKKILENLLLLLLKESKPIREEIYKIISQQPDVLPVESPTKKLEVINAQLQAAMNETEQKLNDKEEEIAILKNEIESKDKDNRGLQEQLAEFKQELINKENETLQLKTEIENKNRDNQELIKNLETTELLNKQLEEKLNNAEQQAKKHKQKLAEQEQSLGEVNFLRNEPELTQRLDLGNLPSDNTQALIQIVAVLAQKDNLERLWQALKTRCEAERRAANTDELQLLKTALAWYNHNWRTRPFQLIEIPSGSSYDYEQHQKSSHTSGGETVHALHLPGIADGSGKPLCKALVNTH